jgi:RNA polymerase sigma factor (sigma-70 family)
MSSSHSISAWIDRLRDSDPDAGRVLWERFADRMLAVARRRLGGAPRRAADEEDAVLAAFEAFLRGVREGRFPRLNDRDDLWAVLLTLTRRAAGRLVRDEARQRRGGGAVRGESAWEGQHHEPADEGPDPEEAAACQDELRRLLEALPDDQLRRIALAKLEGRTNEEIASREDCALATVERRLKLIRLTWGRLGEGPA